MGILLRMVPVINSVLRISNLQYGNCEYKYVDRIYWCKILMKIYFSRLLFSSLFTATDFDKTYDNMHTRLMVRPWDNWKGINPSGIGADFNPDPPIFAARFSQMQNYNHILAIANEDGMASNTVNEPANSE